MWVNARSTRGDEFKLNLGVALSIEEYFDRYEINYPDGTYKVKKTPEMVEAYSSLVPEKSQPVVPAEPDPTEWVTFMDADGTQYRIQGRRMPPLEVEPFRITGLGLYETASGQPVQIISNDGTDPVDNAPWFSPQHGWYKTDGTSLTFNPTKHIVKLIKLDEVQP